MSKISKGKFNLQATQVLNKVEYDVLGNPVGLIESPTDQTSCNFGIDRLPRRGGCYKGDGIAYLSVAGIQITDTYSVSTGSGNPIISSNRIDIINGTILFDLKIYRASVLWAWFKCDENYGISCYDSSGNNHHGVIVNAITVTPEENSASVHQYQNEYSYHNEVGYSKSGSIFIPKNESITLSPFKDVLGNDLQFFGKVPGRVKFVESNCFQQQISACYMTVTGLLATDTITVFGSSAVPTLSAGRMDFVVGSKYYGISIFRSAVLWAYYPMCESIINPSGHIYHDCSGNARHATLINGAVGNESQQNELHYLQKGFNKSGSIFLPKHLTNNTDYLDNALEFQQDTKSFLPSGCFLRQYQQPSLIQADKTSGVWFDANAEPYDVAYETLTLQDPINEQIFIGNSDKTKKLGPISTHKVGLTAVQKRTERVVRNVVDDALIEDPACSHDVMVTAGDLTYSLYNSFGYTMNGIIDWGDGTTQSVNTTANQTITKTYADAGTFTVKFTGTMEYLQPQIVSLANASKITKINNWGNLGIKYLRLQSCSNLVSIPSGPITGLNSTNAFIDNGFNNCTKLTGVISDDLLLHAGMLTSAIQLFFNCTSLTGQIPENLFRYCPNLTTVALAFYNCTGLTGQIPEDLLKYNTKLTTVAGLFYSCISLSGSIPENIFKYNTEIVSFASGDNSIFFRCSGLTGSIPESLFRYNTKASNFDHLFMGCANLTGTIPEDLFKYNTEMTIASGMFHACSKLTGSIPANLFRYNTKITRLGYGDRGCFYNCIGLTGAIPATLFDSLTVCTQFTHVFANCSGLTAIPADIFKYNTAAVYMDRVFESCIGITSIPTGLFDYNTNVTAFTSAFQNTRITTIPSNLFTNNIKVISFSSTFAANPSLAAIPSNLFDTNTLVTTFDNIFNGCTGITSIPVDLFRYNIAVTNMSGVFRSTRITAIPVDLFRYNTNVTKFNSTFAIIGLTTAITLPLDLFRYNTEVLEFIQTFDRTSVILSADLFKYNVKVTNFSGTFWQAIREPQSLDPDLFAYCPLVTKFSDATAVLRQCPGITEIPAGIFRNNTLFTNANLLFEGCVNLQTIPVDLFRYNTNITSFQETFSGCSSLVGIPIDLFRYNVNVTNLSGLFYNCTSLRNIPEDLFYYNSNVVNYGAVFRNSRILNLPTRLFNTANLSKVTTWLNFLNVTSTAYSPTGTIQKIWSTTEGGDVTYTVQPTKTDAFNNCTALSNYAEIPAAYI